jgi:hypothetical protein
MCFIGVEQPGYEKISGCHPYLMAYNLLRDE